MSTFQYRARDNSGEIREGVIEAGSQEGAVDTLHQAGLIVVSIQEKEKSLLMRMQLGGRIRQKDLVVFSRQLATLFEAQIPVVQALKTLVAETEKKTLQQILSHVLDDITGGLSLSQAMAKHPRAFSVFYINLVRSGEESGKLQDVFTYLADYMERSYYLTIKARNAMIYPAFIFMAFLLVLILMMVIVIPRLSTIFEETGQQLPFYTLAILQLSLIMRKWGLIILFLLIVAGVFVFRWAKTDEGRYFFDRLLIKIPIFGSLYRKLYLARMADNLRTLIVGGIPILRALSITGDVVGNVVYKKATDDAVESVKAGNTISSAFEKTPEIPKLVTGMIRIGEASGRLDFILGSIARFYQREVDSAVENMVALIEPILILFLGGGVAVLVASIMIPIYNLVGSF
ncbi:MAG: type II secretion system F family protein [Candidatus Sungbacteria bacterium]|nr:type II secretion system F family protein [bacterium]MDZ4260228.1 type II secretion system F family protein [Candidatus Sungbacteria bacterium]